MIEEVLSNLYRMEIPLPGSPLKTLNSYLIKSPERSLIIDTGWNRDECHNEMLSSLGKLNVDLNQVDFFITHVHPDHIGLVARLFTTNSAVYFNGLEGSIVNSDWHRDELFSLLRSNGFPEDELNKSLEGHPARCYGLKRDMDFYVVQEGDMIEVGDYSFRCIETPGHSPGHICLYDASKKLMICGDHILVDITPNITCWIRFGMDNSLEAYLASLGKVYNLEVSLLLPGHCNITDNHRKRIKELREHHRNRLNEVMSALQGGEKTAFEIAPYISWDVEYRSWATFPASQKWFAVAETLAHLKYLEEDQIVQRKVNGQKTTFCLVGGGSQC